MSPRLAFIAVFSLAAGNLDPKWVAADDTSPSTTTNTTTNSTTTTTTPAHKPATTNLLNGKVEKISDSSLTVRVTYVTGGAKHTGPSNVGHISGSWLPRVVTGPPPKPNPKAKPRTVSQLLTYMIVDTPPVKVVTDGPHPSRTTGSYADVKVGDLVFIGTGPVTTKEADGKSTTHTRVTGIDVLKHPGVQNPTTNPSGATTTKPNN